MTREHADESRELHVPWAMLALHEKQAFRNHQQSLGTLARRGGLAPVEMLAVIGDRSINSVLRLTDREAIDELKREIETFYGKDKP